MFLFGVLVIILILSQIITLFLTIAAVSGLMFSKFLVVIVLYYCPLVETV